MEIDVIGWDIGGAHLKAVMLDAQGSPVQVLQYPCPLWTGLDQLRSAVNELLKIMPSPAAHHAITMTGELADCFQSRAEGVEQILNVMKSVLSADDLLVYAGSLGFLRADSITEAHYQAIASANWLASADYAVKHCGNGLFIDIGSTTTDILALVNGQVLAQGLTDYERLITRELIYTGVVRTAVMAIANRFFFKGHDVGVMAEYFATMADVYRLTEELDEAHDQYESADGAEKTRQASAKRLARMIGMEWQDEPFSSWSQLAQSIRAEQVRTLQLGCERQLSRACWTKVPPLIGAGVGRFLVKQLAVNMRMSYVDFSDLLPVLPETLGLSPADCAPALAVAFLSRSLKNTVN
ncbi:MAG: hydantoinase/oxoprolinase family protein [Methylicorpusculum sp.]|nr:hydantoinase/oxoprolinase family protein [Methylicorpusculum sp.]